MAKRETSARKALYRVHRSHDFSEVVGQDHIVQTLKTAIKNGRISHAYLFTGPRGVGKTSVARILAHTINELAYSDESLTLDIIEIDAASNRGIDEIRELRDKVHIAPSSGRYKVYIIDEVHMLTTPAFNALLKTLEEPPRHAVFILATTEAHKVPETITSRTQRFTFRPIAKDIMTKHLLAIAKKEKININEEAVELLAQHANGSLRDGIGLLDQLQAIKDRVTKTEVENLLGLAPSKQLEELLKATGSGDVTALLRHLDNLYSQGASPTQIAAQLIDDQRLSLYAGGDVDMDLIENLLQVASSREPRLKLEVVLARAALEAPPSASHSAMDSKLSSPSDKVSASQAEAKPKQPASDDASARGNIPPGKWAELLKQVKAHNNSLYAVLRLAEPTKTDKHLILAFAFEFHQARAIETRNKELVEKLVEQILGDRLTLKAEINKELQAKTAVAEDDGGIMSVIGVMGGGSVVEYEDG